MTQGYQPPSTVKRRSFIRGSAILGASLAYPRILKSDSGMLHPGSTRKVYRILNTDRTRVGTLPILRAFAGDHLDHVSPYVLFDEFGPVDLLAGSDPLRVDAHPHAGIIPTTYSCPAAATQGQPAVRLSGRQGRFP